MTGHYFQGYISRHITWSGVDLFFVLSGFFISGILFREYQVTGHIKAGRFLIRRMFKIWPLFYAAFLIQLFYFSMKGQYPGTEKALHEVLFIQNYCPGFMMITWSLGVEEQFYLLIAFLFPFLLKYFFTTVKVVFTIAVILLLILSLRIINSYIYTGFDAYKNVFPMHLRADSLCAGILISYFYHFKRDWFQNWVFKYRALIILLCVIFLLPLVFFSYMDSFTYTIGYTTTYLGYSLLVILSLFSNGKSFFYYSLKMSRILSIVSWVGFYSYAIYLFHYFIGFGAVNNFREQTGIGMNSTFSFLIFLSSNILFGYLISTIIEQPALRLREKLYPSYNQ